MGCRGRSGLERDKIVPGGGNSRGLRVPKPKVQIIRKRASGSQIPST